MKIIIGSDHGGFRLKEKLVVHLRRKGHLVKDIGTHSPESCDYPKFAYLVAEGVSRRGFSRGVIICKSGIGNSIVANKLPRIRAALCYNPKAARLSRQHNDANILIMGASFVNEKKAKQMLDLWLKTEFLGGRHRRRLEQIERIERNIIKDWRPKT